MSNEAKNVPKNRKRSIRGSDWGSVVALAIHVVGGIGALALGFETEGTILITSGVAYKATQKTIETVVRKERDDS